jgi:hypothetical protein
MKLFRELLLSRAGKAAIITGGSIALPADFHLASARYPDAVVISPNQHGCVIGVEVDFICCYDNIHGILRDAAEKHRISVWPPIITYHTIPGHEVYKLLEYPVWPMSGQLACWIALSLGCCPIILCGMGCYNPNEGTYCHDADFKSEGLRIPLETHKDDWIRVREALKSARIRAVSGPLVGIFDQFDPNERFDDYVLPDRLKLLESQTGKVVKITRPCRVGEDRFEPDMIVEIPRKDAENLFERRRAVPARVSVN